MKVLEAQGIFIEIKICLNAVKMLNYFLIPLIGARNKF